MEGDEEMMPTGSFEHLGCFNDNKDDRVLGHRLKSPMMDAKVCVCMCMCMGMGMCMGVLMIRRAVLYFIGRYKPLL